MFSTGQRLVIILMLLSFMSLPLVTMAGGFTEPYGQKPFSAVELSPVRFLRANDKKRNATLEAILERSSVTKKAIMARYWSMIHLEGFVNTDRIVSGLGNWLFIKRQFWQQNCRFGKRANLAIQRALLTTELVEGFGGKIIFTVSPDKAFAMSEMMSERGRIMFPCKHQESKRWRQINAALGSPINDHFDAVVDAKDLGYPTYFSTDTHWTRNISTFVINDIRASLRLKPVKWNLVGKEIESRKTDLRNNMLLQSPFENYQRLIFQTQKGAQWPRTFVVHDSYYDALKKDFEAFWPEFQMRYFYNLSDEDIRTAFLANIPIIFNTVERSFMELARTNSRLQKGIMGYMADFVEKNCTFDKEFMPAEIVNLKSNGKEFKPININPSIIYHLPKFLEGKFGCAKVQMTVEQNERVQIFFHSNNPGSYFVAGRSIVFDLKPGINYLRFMIPKHRAGNWLRINPARSNKSFKLDFKIGELR